MVMSIWIGLKNFCFAPLLSFMRGANGGTSGGANVMAKKNRSSQTSKQGGKLITSHSALSGLPIDAEDKDYFLELLIRLSGGYFVRINNFAIMGNHFHLQIEHLAEEAQQATPQELLARYHRMWEGRVPPNSGIVNGLRVFDKDKTGITRLRKRLGSDSRFMQELKQTFSRYYNKKYGRDGYFWDSPFDSVPLQNGLSRVVGGAYTEINAVSVGIVGEPGDYRWCSEGLRKQDPELWAKLITPMMISHQLVDEYLPQAEREKEHDVCLVELMAIDRGRLDFLCAYINRMLHGEDAVYESDVDPRIIASIKSMDRQLNLQHFFKNGCRNLTNGIAVGSYDMILEIQKKNKRKHLTPRPLMEVGVLFGTRKLK